jgi:hypothetical protein
MEWTSRVVTQNVVRPLQRDGSMLVVRMLTSGQNVKSVGGSRELEGSPRISLSKIALVDLIRSCNGSYSFAAFGASKTNLTQKPIPAKHQQLELNVDKASIITHSSLQSGAGYAISTIGNSSSSATSKPSCLKSVGM